MRHQAAALLLAAIAFCSAGVCEAFDLKNALTGYAATSWAQKDGLPKGTIWAIAQDREGYLWLGLDTGLVRFDGVRFVRWSELSDTPLPSPSVKALLAAADGSLWVGFDVPGGIARITNGTLRTYAEADGIPKVGITAIAQESGGLIWAGTTLGLFQLHENRWERWASRRGLPDGSIHSAHLDRRDNLLVAMGRGIFRRRPGAPAFEAVQGPSAQALRVPAENTWISPFAHRAIASDATGRVYLSDPTVGFRVLNDPAFRLHADERSRGQRFLYDHRDNMWIGTWSEGLWRIHTPAIGAGAVIEKVTALTGLASEGVSSLLEDRDANIWAGTTDGLTRLTPHRFEQITTLGIVDGLQATADGALWAGTLDDGLVRYAMTGGEWHLDQKFLPGVRVYAMHADHRGVLWAATGQGLLGFDHGRMVPLRLPGVDGLKQVTTMASDADGGLWLSDGEMLVRWKDGRADVRGVFPAVGRTHIGMTYADRAGRIWLGFTDGVVAVIGRDGRVTHYGVRDGLDGGAYRAVYEDPDGTLWLGGDHYGLSRFANGRFDTVHPTEIAVTAITADDQGHLWLRTSSGIATLDRREFDEALKAPGRRLEYALYQRADGVAGAPAWFGERIAVRSVDGRLWFITGPGLTVIDPGELRRRAPTPAVRVEGIVANDQRWSEAASGAALPAGTTRLEIHYSALDLTSPQKARFAYHLDGIDRGWVDAESRRQAFYTNLAPGQYRFQVKVNYGGINDVSEASWPFTIQPRFSQTLWFPASVAGILLLAGYLAWQVRLGQVRKRFALVIGERVRLGREIHDTLLQRLAGVALQCDALAPDLTPAATRRLMRIREQVEDSIRDARQSIWNLRASNAGHDDLIRALREAGQQATESSNVRFALRVGGTPNGFSGPVAEQLLKIGREAIANASRHAQAGQISVELNYEENAVRLRVSDDGRGFDPQRVQSENGHCGISGMKERAAAVDGALTIATTVGHGTVVEAVVPDTTVVEEAV